MVRNNRGQVAQRHRNRAVKPCARCGGTRPARLTLGRREIPVCLACKVKPATAAPTGHPANYCELAAVYEAKNSFQRAVARERSDIAACFRDYQAINKWNANLNRQKAAAARFKGERITYPGTDA